MGFNWLGEIGLLNRIINTIAEDQSLTSLAILTEGALKEKRTPRNRRKDAPETVTRINSTTKADPQSINTKKDIIKGGRTKKKVNHQTPMVENVIADRDIEMEITSILSDSTRNILATCNRNTSLVSERLSFGNQ